MSQPALASAAPVPFLRRAFDWWLAQVKHALPPTIFFFIGFNLILVTKRLILQEHGVEFSGFLTATLAALLVGKAVLITDNLPFMHRFDGAPMIQPVLFKSAIYWLCVLVVRLAEGLVHFLAAGGLIADFPAHIVEHFSWARFLSIQIWLMVLFLLLRRDPRTQPALRRRRTLPPVLPLAFVRGQAHPPSANSSAHAAQPADRGEPDRGLQRPGLASAH